MTSAALAKTSIPPYGHRKDWVPRRVEDFGDSGAFPEIHVPQYPLSMGKTKKTSNALAVQLDQMGTVKFDLIAKQGASKNKIVYSKFTDLLPKQMTEEDAELARPDEETINEVTEKTRKALEALVSSKVSAAMPVKAAQKTGPDQFIRYTPSNQGMGFNSGAEQRIIRMVDVQSDPMEPPKFKINTKIPKGPPSPPAPVMHSPTRKVTVKEQQEWKIPPCISNWKNPKGYTVPLDKRLAADGRGMQGVHINENFSKLSEALYIADRTARESIEMRAKMEKSLAEKEKAKKEEDLKALASQIREQRSGIKPIKDDKEMKEREDIRREREKERARDRAIQRAAPEKRTQLQKAKERDISELIALGMPNAGKPGGETQFDTRLFNSSKGIDSGFSEEDAYTVYDKPWREEDAVQKAIYRPSKKVTEDDDFEKKLSKTNFVPDKGFEGAERNGQREGPVEFEAADNFDPFKINDFLSKVNKREREGGADKSSKKGKR